MFRRIQLSDKEDRRVVMIVPNPCPTRLSQGGAPGQHVEVSCRNLHVFAMDEYANEEESIAPEGWQLGFMHSLLAESVC